MTTVMALTSVIAPAPASAQIDDIYEKSLIAAHQALAQFGTVEDTERGRRIQDIGYRVAQASRYEQYPLTFYLIDIPEPNAFALPGGQIFVTRGMLALDLTDDEVAALLGHEIAHVALEHGIRIQRKAALLNGLSAAVLVGVIAGSSDSNAQPRYPGEVYSGSNTGNLVEGTAAAGALVTELLMRNYSRGFEDESDLEGQRWASGAGFDPAGMGQMLAKLGAAIPQDRNYGYWRTHPFNDLRVRAAKARGEQLKAQPEREPADYRRETQRKLLAMVQHTDEPKLKRLLEDSAVVAWPRGPAADRIRLARLHERREALLAKSPLSRDYTALLDRYQQVADEVENLDPESSLPKVLKQEATEVRELRRRSRDDFLQAYQGGVIQTETLEALLANYADFEAEAEARLQLADRYARLDRPGDAVEQYLSVLEQDPDSEHGQRAQRALTALVDSVQDLCALERLRRQQLDAAVATHAGEALASAVADFVSLAAGADYLACSEDGAHVDAVRARLEVLAESRLADVLLHQSIGNAAKAVQGIDDILTHAPWTEAADRLRRQQRQAAGLEETPS